MKTEETIAVESAGVLQEKIREADSDAAVAHPPGNYFAAIAAAPGRDRPGRGRGNPGGDVGGAQLDP